MYYSLYNTQLFFKKIYAYKVVIFRIIVIVVNNNIVIAVVFKHKNKINKNKLSKSKLIIVN